MHNTCKQYYVFSYRLVESRILRGEKQQMIWFVGLIAETIILCVFYTGHFAHTFAQKGSFVYFFILHYDV